MEKKKISLRNCKNVDKFCITLKSSTERELQKFEKLAEFALKEAGCFRVRSIGMQENLLFGRKIDPKAPNKSPRFFSRPRATSSENFADSAAVEVIKNGRNDRTMVIYSERFELSLLTFSTFDSLKFAFNFMPLSIVFGEH